MAKVEKTRVYKVVTEDGDSLAVHGTKFSKRYCIGKTTVAHPESNGLYVFLDFRHALISVSDRLWFGKAYRVFMCEAWSENAEGPQNTRVIPRRRTTYTEWYGPRYFTISTPSSTRCFMKVRPLYEIDPKTGKRI